MTAELIDAGLGSDEDFYQVDVKGKIALIKRGEYSFYEKTQNAAKAGAVGAIIFNNEPGNLDGTLGEPTDIPSVSLSDAEGEALKERLDPGEKVVLTLKVDTVLKNSYSQNVIGTIRGKKGGPSKKGRRSWWGPIMTGWIRPPPTIMLQGRELCWNWPGCCPKSRCTTM